MGKFSIYNNIATKTLECKVEGVITVQEAVSFIDQFRYSITTISPSQYILSFDCTQLSVSTKDSQEKLEECFKLYKEANFKQIVCQVGKNSILKMQLTRMANTVHLDNFSVE